jgi:hypothetical protein
MARQDLIYPTDVFKGGPGRAVGQQGSREAGTGGQGTALALRAGGRYGTVEQQADWLQQGSREAGTGGRALPWNYGQGADMGQ